MANPAKIRIEFTSKPLTGYEVSFEIRTISGDLIKEFLEVSVNDRISPNQFERGVIDELETNENLWNALRADYPSPNKILLGAGRSFVEILAESYDRKFVYTGDTNNTIITITEEVEPAPEFTILSTTPQPPQTLPVCDNQRVKLNVENAVYPITINSAAGTKTAANDSELWVELPRYLPGEITLTDDTGAVDSVTPDSVRTWTIDQVSIEESQSGATIAITTKVLTTGSALNYQYSIDGTNYQNSNAFSGILPGTYTAYIRDSFNCIKTQSFTVEGLETPRPEPNFTIEKANPLRFINAATPEFRNVENTLFNEQDNTNIEKYYFRQPWQSGSIVRTQIKTSYRDLVAKIYDCDNELTDEIIPEKKVTNIGQKDKRDCIATSNPENGNLIVFFQGGNIYEPGTTNVINTYSSRGPLPNFVQVGMLCSLSLGIRDFDNVTVKGFVYSEKFDFWCIEFDVYSELESSIIGSLTSTGTCESTFNAEIYDIFEFSFSKTTGQYRVEIEGTDENSNYPDILHVSEPIFFDELEKVVTLQYSSEDNQSGINYQTGIEFLLNVPGRLFNYSPSGEDESFTDDLGNKIIQKAVYVQQRELQTGLIPDWLAEKIVIASTHENFKINGLELTMMDRPEVESKSENNNPFYVLTCIYQLKNKIVRDEQVGVVSSSRAVIGADAGAVLGV